MITKIILKVSKKKFTISNFLVESATKLQNIFSKWVKVFYLSFKTLVISSSYLVFWFPVLLEPPFGDSESNLFKGTIIPELSDKPILIEKMFQWI